MLGQRVAPVLAILSLLVIDIDGTQYNYMCPSGIPVSMGCNSFLFPSSCPNEYYCYASTERAGFCCPNVTRVACPRGSFPAGRCRPFAANQCPINHFCSFTSVRGLGMCCPLD